MLRRLSFVPADPLGCWPSLHRRPQNGFIFGSGAGTVSDPVVMMSVGEPARIYKLSSLSQFPSSVGRGGHGTDLPRWVGFFSFDAGRWFDPALDRLPRQPHPLKTPTAFFGEYHNVVKFDLLKHQTTIVAANRRELDRIENSIHQMKNGADPISPQNKLPSKFHHKTQKQFGAMVRHAKKAISAGDIYQANLSLRFEKKFKGNPVDLYRRLSQKNPSPYACLLKMGSQWIVSTSPELLIAVEGRDLRTRPIAGTRPRGKNRGDDKKKSGQLLLSPKERAEHIMLVDLERNDLGRVCEPGSVHVTERFSIERYSHVMHIVSEVRGRLRKNLKAMDALRAVFPGGTISGCPKYRAIEIIEELEGVARGPFYGSAGFFDGRGNAIFNILIRTAVIAAGKVAIQAGAGIVADSNSQREYAETLAKAQALLETI